MRRRIYLIGSITALTTIAGCGSPGPGANGTELSPTGGPLGTESPTVSPTTTEEMTTTEDTSPTTTTTEEVPPTETEQSPTQTETDSPTGTETPTQTPDGAETIQMITQGSTSYFDPIGIAIESGTTIEWAAPPATDHSTTAYEDRIPADADPWDSGVLTDDNAMFSHTFETEGTYDYYCSVHQAQGMVGRIVVGEPGGPAEGTMPSDGDVPESQRIVEDGMVSYADFTSG